MRERIEYDISQTGAASPHARGTQAERSSTGDSGGPAVPPVRAVTAQQPSSFKTQSQLVSCTGNQGGGIDPGVR